jgi:hypothetical protein
MTYYYFAVIDYDGTVTSIYYSLVVGITTTFFILITFNESWLVSTVVYSPCLVFYMEKTGEDLVDYNEQYELYLRSFFAIFIYAVMAYKTESLSKESFLGRESSDKAFHRWLKIFETFPEGIALVRNNYVLYANKSLKDHLNIAGEAGYEKDPYYEALKENLG